MLARLVVVLGDLDPAGLAAAPDLHLGLDHAREADLLGGRHGVVRCRRAAVGNRDAVLGEELLSLYSSRSMRRGSLSDCGGHGREGRRERRDLPLGIIPRRMPLPNKNIKWVTTDCYGP